MRTQAVSKLRGEGPSPPFSIDPPESFPVGLFIIMPVLGHPSLEDLTHHWLTGQAQGQGGWSKVGRGGAPAREISFVSLMAYGPKVSDLVLTMGGYRFWNQAGWFPTVCEIEFILVLLITVLFFIWTTLNLLLSTPVENNCNKMQWWSLAQKTKGGILVHTEEWVQEEIFLFNVSYLQKIVSKHSQIPVILKISTGWNLLLSLIHIWRCRR